jgi:glycerol-3-phosphate dehydrogenase
MESRPRAVIIGAGFTGCALAYDLAQRGFSVDVLERGEIASGTSGRTHGLLHSGGRYCVTDQEAAIECIQENRILMRIAKQCIEANGGLFVALTESDLAYSERFEQGAQACGIPIEKLGPREILRLESNLSPKILGGYTVPDAVFDPLRLALAFAASAVQLGVRFHTFHEVVGMQFDGQGRLSGVKAINRHSGQNSTFHADVTINATGAWAGILARLAGRDVPVQPTPGVMVAYDRRLTQRVINRLCEPADGDIIIPQRRMAVIGTTSFEVDDPDYIPVTDEQIQSMHDHAFQLIPGLAQAKVHGAYMSARPLIAGVTSGRSLSRTFKCYDHEADDGLAGFITVTGGKATTCRVMAEKTADLACRKLGIMATCNTAEVPLVDYHHYYINVGMVSN